MAASVHLVIVDEDMCTPYMRAKVLMHMVRGASRWSETRGCSTIDIHVTTGFNLLETGRVVKRFHARTFGIDYIICLNSYLERYIGF